MILDTFYFEYKLKLRRIYPRISLKLFLNFFKNLNKIKLKLFRKTYKRKENIRIKIILKLLKKYKVEIDDVDTIKFIISELENLKKERNPFFILLKTIKFSSQLIVGIILFLCQESLRNHQYGQMIMLLSLVLSIYSILFGINYALNEILFKNYNYLINDLKQVIVFRKILKSW